MNALHLIWIILLSVCFGFTLADIMAASKR